MLFQRLQGHASPEKFQDVHCLLFVQLFLSNGNGVDSVQAIQVLPGSALTLSSALVGIEWPGVASFTVHNGEVECQSIVFIVVLHET